MWGLGKFSGDMHPTGGFCEASFILITQLERFLRFGRISRFVFGLASPREVWPRSVAVSAKISLGYPSFCSARGVRLARALFFQAGVPGRWRCATCRAALSPTFFRGGDEHPAARVLKPSRMYRAG